MRRVGVGLCVGLLLGTGALVSQGPRTPFANLPVITDANGYLTASAAQITNPVGPRTPGANARLRTDANGRLLIALAVGPGPDSAEYWVGAADATLTAEKNLGALATALVVNTGGVPSAYAGVTCTNQFLRVLSAIGAGTCATVTSAYVDSSIALRATEETTTSTGTVNNFDLDASVTYLRVNNASAVTLTGFTVAGSAPAAGDRVVIDNIGSSTVTVAHQNTGSTAANRAMTSSTNGQIIGANGRMVGVYDTTTDRWRVEVVDPGAPIEVAFNAADFTGDGSMTWTVESADLLAFRYVQRGRTLNLLMFAQNTTVGGTLSTQLLVAMPGGFTSTLAQAVPAIHFDNGAAQSGRSLANAAATTVINNRVPIVNWSAATDATVVSVPWMTLQVD